MTEEDFSEEIYAQGELEKLVAKFKKRREIAESALPLRDLIIHLDQGTAFIYSEKDARCFYIQQPFKLEYVTEISDDEFADYHCCGIKDPVGKENSLINESFKNWTEVFDKIYFACCEYQKSKRPDLYQLSPEERDKNWRECIRTFPREGILESLKVIKEELIPRGSYEGALRLLGELKHSHAVKKYEDLQRFIGIFERYIGKNKK